MSMSMGLYVPPAGLISPTVSPALSRGGFTMAAGDCTRTRVPRPTAAAPVTARKSRRDLFITSTPCETKPADGYHGFRVLDQMIWQPAPSHKCRARRHGGPAGGSRNAVGCRCPGLAGAPPSRPGPLSSEERFVGQAASAVDSERVRG